MLYMYVLVIKELEGITQNKPFKTKQIPSEWNSLEKMILLCIKWEWSFEVMLAYYAHLMYNLIYSWSSLYTCIQCSSCVC